MKTIFTIFFCVLFTINIQSQSTISAGNVSGTWTKAGSPYKIQGEIKVPKGSTLVLQPGTVVEFQDTFGLRVEGVLKAEGKRGDSIYFKPRTGVNMAGRGYTWAGIYYFNNFETDTIRFRFCSFEGVKKGFNYGKGLGVFYALQSVGGSPIIIKNSSFLYNNNKVDQAGCLYLSGNYVILDSLYFQSTAAVIESSRGLIGIDSSLGFNIQNIRFNIVKNVISFSPIASFKTNFGGVLDNISNDSNTYFYMTLAYSRNVTIQNLKITGIGTLFMRDNRNVILINSIFTGSSRHALRTFGNMTGCIVENCLFTKCGNRVSNPGYSSIDIHSSGPLFKNCKMLDNITGISVSQDYGSGTPLFLNCIFSSQNSPVGGAEGYPVFINCNFVNNYFNFKPINSNTLPLGAGFGISREFYNSRPYFYNCVFWGNNDSFDNNNSIVLFGKAVKVDMYNCIIQGDSSKGIVCYDDNFNQKIPLVRSNVVYTNSTGNNPGFIDSASGNFQLINTCSQRAYAINKGSSGNLLSQYPYNILNSVYKVNIYNTTDLAGNPRVTDDTLDIGCYESAGNKRNLKLLSSFTDTTLCYGGNNTYSSKTAGAVQQYQWQQKQNNAISTIANTRTLSLSNIKQNGYQYRLQVINNECLPLKDSSAWFSVSVNSPVKKGITQNKDTLYQKDTVEFSTVSQNYTQIKWSTGATSPILKLKGSSFNTLGTHAISVEAIKNTGCTETDTAYVYIKANSSIHSKQAIYGIKIYPQPSQSILNIAIGESISNAIGFGGAFFYISNIDGKILMQQGLSHSKLSLPIHHLESGIYIITISINNELFHLKWIKE